MSENKNLPENPNNEKKDELKEILENLKSIMNSLKDLRSDTNTNKILIEKIDDSLNGDDEYDLFDDDNDEEDDENDDMSPMLDSIEEATEKLYDEYDGMKEAIEDPEHPEHEMYQQIFQSRIGDLANNIARKKYFEGPGRTMIFPIFGQPQKYTPKFLFDINHDYELVIGDSLIGFADGYNDEKIAAVYAEIRCRNKNPKIKVIDLFNFLKSNKMLIQFAISFIFDGFVEDVDTIDLDLHISDEFGTSIMITAPEIHNPKVLPDWIYEINDTTDFINFKSSKVHDPTGKHPIMISNAISKHLSEPLVISKSIFSMCTRDGMKFTDLDVESVFSSLIYPEIIDALKLLYPFHSDGIGIGLADIGDIDYREWIIKQQTVYETLANVIFKITRSDYMMKVVMYITPRMTKSEEGHYGQFKYLGYNFYFVEDSIGNSKSQHVFLDRIRQTPLSQVMSFGSCGLGLVLEPSCDMFKFATEPVLCISNINYTDTEIFAPRLEEDFCKRFGLTRERILLFERVHLRDENDKRIATMWIPQKKYNVPLILKNQSLQLPRKVDVVYVLGFIEIPTENLNGMTIVEYLEGIEHLVKEHLGIDEFLKKLKDHKISAVKMVDNDASVRLAVYSYETRELKEESDDSAKNSFLKGLRKYRTE